MNHRRARILSVGTAVPETIMTNGDFEAFLDTSDEWIYKRTGIRQRHMFPRDNPGSASELGSEAARVALQRAGIGADQLDGVICATFTPDNFFPSTACGIARHLGCDTLFGFDISAACAGFVYGLGVARAMIESGQCDTILLVGSEIISRTLDWADRSTCILFGDAAGAVVLKATEEPDRGVLGTTLSAIPSLGDILVLPATGEKRCMRMNGNEVFRNAVRMMAEAMNRCLDQCGLSIQNIDLLIPHQANARIIHALAEQMNFPQSQLVMNLERYGNTSSASIPLALNEAWGEGRVKDGTTILFTSLGGGITVGSAVVRF